MTKAQQPIDEHFSRGQVRRILGISERQLAAWERQGLVQPAQPSQPARRGHRASSQECLYTFSDIVTLKTLLRLRRNRVPLARIRLALASLKEKLAEVEKPLSELLIKGEGQRLAVHFQGTRMEPVTGQFLLDFEPNGEKGKIQPLQPVNPAKKLTEAGKRARAEEFFLAGLRYEEKPEAMPEAIRAYQKAIALNPQAVGAFINLGTLHYNSGQLDEAERYYQAALSIDPDYGLVYFNLGNVFEEKNQLEEARQHYEQAVRLDPAYADAHYNLALVYDKLGLHGKARQQWRWYLKLDPGSHWSVYARQQLEKTSFRLIRQEKSSSNDS